MSKAKSSGAATGNYILDSIPAEDFDKLADKLKPVQLTQSEVLYHARQPIHQVYFPTTALLSWVASTEEGEMIEAGITGYEGMTGASTFLGQDLAPYRVDVQLSGSGFKMGAAAFKEAYDRSHFLQSLVLKYTHMQLMQLAQSVVCNRFHTVEERLCRWLLIAHDRVKSDEFQLTQEILANMIGARRPAISIVTGTLQTAGLIRSRRAKITIVDREGLEAAACECYRIVKEEFDRFLGR
ncbi:MAG TPA: Crp/Fnr family transcriptional regulator [Blastocatellia bacterium]|nr:Crp/Fnr family transcriptional regulator [Blastocatellia bacterium]